MGAGQPSESTVKPQGDGMRSCGGGARGVQSIACRISCRQEERDSSDRRCDEQTIALLHDPMARPLNTTRELVKTQTQGQTSQVQPTDWTDFTFSQRGGLPNGMISVHLETATCHLGSSLLANRELRKGLPTWPKWL